MSALSEIEELAEKVLRVRREIEALEAQLDGYDHRAKFEKCKNCLRALYYDSDYSSRSEWVNEMLDEPEVQAWIREEVY